MTKIGTEANAKRCVEIATSEEFIDYEKTPVGWTFLGAGCSRQSFLGPDGVVYKYEIGVWSDNETEHLNAIAWRQAIYNSELFGKWDIPETYLHVVTHNRESFAIIAMEYVTGKRESYHVFCFTEEQERKISEADRAAAKAAGHFVSSLEWTRKVERPLRRVIPISDLHTDNYFLREDGVRVIIDVAN